MTGLQFSILAFNRPVNRGGALHDTGDLYHADIAAVQSIDDVFDKQSVATATVKESPTEALPDTEAKVIVEEPPTAAEPAMKTDYETKMQVMDITAAAASEEDEETAVISLESEVAARGADSETEEIEIPSIVSSIDEHAPLAIEPPVYKPTGADVWNDEKSISESSPAVDIIIPHFNGVEIIDKCLASLGKTAYQNFKVTIVDNGTADESLVLAERKYPWVKILRSEKNLGYAGGCNFGFGRTAGKYVVFLNNDTEQEPDWLTHLVRMAEPDASFAALQPKILSIQARDRGERIFDYAGAAGGMMDTLGFPYAKGRVFDKVETDHGQYDEPSEIFWASGTAMFVRRSAVETTGVFDDDFFAHMEEIDLCWRLLLAGYRIGSVPKSVVYHYGGATLAAGNPRKVYLNHRNSIMMIIKNISLLRLLYLLPLRVGLDLASIMYYWRRYGGGYTGHVLNAIGWNFFHFGKLWRKRREVQTMRKRTDAQIFKHAGKWLVLRKAIAG